MKEKRLAWWIFKCLTVILTIGLLIVTYSQYRLYRQLESSSIRSELEKLSFLAQDIISRAVNQTPPSSVEYSNLCQQLALLTRTRTTIITKLRQGSW